MARKVKLDLAVKVPRGEADKVMKYAKKYNRDNLQLDDACDSRRYARTSETVVADRHRTIRKRA